MVRTTTHTKEFSGEVVAPDLSFPVCDSSGPKAEHEETVSTSAAGENDSVERTHWCTVDDSADQSSRCSRRPRQRSHQCPNKTCMPTNCNHVDPPGNELGQLQLVVASRCTSSKGSSGGLNNSADRICNGSGSPTCSNSCHMKRDCLNASLSMNDSCCAPSEAQEGMLRSASRETNVVNDSSPVTTRNEEDTLTVYGGGVDIPKDDDVKLLCSRGVRKQEPNQVRAQKTAGAGGAGERLLEISTAIELHEDTESSQPAVVSEYSPTLVGSHKIPLDDSADNLVAARKEANVLLPHCAFATEEEASQDLPVGDRQSLPIAQGPELGNCQSVYKMGVSYMSSEGTTPCKGSSLHLSCTPEVSPLLCQLIDENVIAPLSQNALEATQHRRAQLRRLAGYLNEAINHVARRKGVKYGKVRYYVFGSLATRTVLPDGDNDITIDIDGLLDPVKVGPQGDTQSTSQDGGEASGCSSEFSGASPAQAAAIAGGELLSNIADYLRENNDSVFVDAVVVAEVRVAKLIMDGNSYDVTVGQLGGVSCIRFLHQVDTKIGCGHLLKRTLLLMKAWCCYEAHVLSGQGGYMSSYAATVMLIAMINTIEFLEDAESEACTELEEPARTHALEGRLGALNGVSPLQLFARFLKYFSCFDFERYCVTLFGPVPCEKINDAFLDADVLKELTMSCDEGLGEVNALGLTPKGLETLGSRVRRRVKPLITVSELREVLSDEDDRTQKCGTDRDRLCPPNGKKSEDSTITDELSREPGEQRHETHSGPVEEERLTGGAGNTIQFPLRTMNVMDPLRWGSNVCRGVCRNHLHRIRRAFWEGLLLFEMASLQLAGGRYPLDNSSGPSVVSNPPIEGSAVESLDDGVTRQHFNEGVKQALLHDLFGCTLQTMSRYWPDPSQGTIHLPLPKCKQCKLPSFFCVVNVGQICDPQFIFDSPESSSCHGGDQERKESPISLNNTNSIHAIPLDIRQQQRRQCQPSKVPPSPVSVHCRPMHSSPTSPPMPTAALAPHSANYVERCGWPLTNNQLYSTSMASPLRQQYVRGMPLMRTCPRGAARARGPLIMHPSLPPGGSLEYPTESFPFPCYPGCVPAVPSMDPLQAHRKTKAVDGGLIGVVPPPSFCRPPCHGVSTTQMYPPPFHGGVMPQL